MPRLSLRGCPVIDVRIHIEPLDGVCIPWLDRLTTLRGQLTIIRMRAESGIPVSVESIARAENLARTLELFEVAP
jgi:hypothetical protein